MAELLVMANDTSHPDHAIDLSGCFKKGDIVHVAEDGHTWGAKEALPDFVIVKVPGVTLAQADKYHAAWLRQLAYSVVSSDLTTDTFTITVSNSLPGATNQAALTRMQVETFLNNWNAVVVSVATNSVTFTIRIAAALTSVGMWGEYARVGSTPVVSFSEQSYDQATGLHTISADYSATPINASAAATAVTSRGGSVVSNSAGVIGFTMTRVNARTAFQNDVADKLRDIYKARRWAFSAANVDTAVAAGGVMTITVQQAQTLIRDATA